MEPELLSLSTLQARRRANVNYARRQGNCDDLPSWKIELPISLGTGAGCRYPAHGGEGGQGKARTIRTLLADDLETETRAEDLAHCSPE
jgi:hypothetical protein